MQSRFQLAMDQAAQENAALRQEIEALRGATAANAAQSASGIDSIAQLLYLWYPFPPSPSR